MLGDVIPLNLTDRLYISIEHIIKFYKVSDGGSEGECWREGGNLYNSRADNFCCALQIEATGILKRSFTKLNPEHCMMIASGFKTCRLEKCFPSCALKSNILYFVVQNVFLLLVNQK